MIELMLNQLSDPFNFLRHQHCWSESWTGPASSVGIEISLMQIKTLFSSLQTTRRISKSWKRRWVLQKRKKSAASRILTQDQSERVTPLNNPSINIYDQHSVCTIYHSCSGWSRGLKSQLFFTIPFHALEVWRLQIMSETMHSGLFADLRNENTIWF